MASNDPATGKQLNALRLIFERGPGDFDAWRPVIAEVTQAHGPGFGAMPAAYDGFANWITRKAPKLTRGQASQLMDHFGQQTTPAPAPGA